MKEDTNILPTIYIYIYIGHSGQQLIKVLPSCHSTQSNIYLAQQNLCTLQTRVKIIAQLDKGKFSSTLAVPSLSL